MLSVKVDRIPILPIGDSVDQGPTNLNQIVPVNVGKKINLFGINFIDLGALHLLALNSEWKMWF